MHQSSTTIKADTIDWTKDNHIIVSMYEKTSFNPKSVKCTFPDGEVVTVDIEKPRDYDFIYDAPLTC